MTTAPGVAMAQLGFDPNPPELIEDVPAPMTASAYGSEWPEIPPRRPISFGIATIAIRATRIAGDAYRSIDAPSMACIPMCRKAERLATKTNTLVSNRAVSDSVCLFQPPDACLLVPVNLARLHHEAYSPQA